MVCSKRCWAKAVSLSKVIDLRSAGFMRTSHKIIFAPSIDRETRLHLFAVYGRAC